MSGQAEDRREELRLAIERHRGELRDALGQLNVAARRQFDLTRRVAEHPVPWLVGAFVVGLWLGARRRPQH